MRATFVFDDHYTDEISPPLPSTERGALSGRREDEDDEDTHFGASAANNGPAGGLRVVPGAVTFQNTDAMTKVSGQ